MKSVGIDRNEDGIDGDVGRPDIAVRDAAERLDALRERFAVAGVKIGKMQIREECASGRGGLISNKRTAVDDRVVSLMSERAAPK